jgi:hypothetical protein
MTTKPRTPQILVLIGLEDLGTYACRHEEPQAYALPEIYSVEFIGGRGWGRHLDGSQYVTFKLRVTSPPGVLPPIVLPDPGPPPTRKGWGIKRYFRLNRSTPRRLVGLRALGGRNGR